MLRFYAYPQLAVAPIDQNSVSTLSGPGATVFDVATLSEIDTDLTTKAETVGDIKASEEAGDNILVWVNTSSTKDSDGIVRSRSVDRVAFDATTGQAVNCCGEYYETIENEPQEIEHKGLVFKFPFDTQKDTYPFWDSALTQVVPIEYKGLDEVEGVTVYKFSHTIDPTRTSTSEVPASLLGLVEEGNVSADRMYSNIRTLWVEPETGVIIKREEQQNNTIQYQGVDRITTTAVTTGYDGQTVKANADEYGRLGGLLVLVRDILPLILVILGPILIALGWWLSRNRDSRGKRTA